MKKIFHIVMLYILLPALLITTPSIKQPKPKVQSDSNVVVKKTKFIVPKEILHIINEEKATIFCRAYNNDAKNNKPQNINEFSATQLANKPTSNVYKQQDQKTNEYRQRQKEYKKTSQCKNNTQSTQADITIDIETHVKEILIEMNIYNRCYEETPRPLPRFLFEEQENFNTAAQDELNFQTCFNDDFLEATDLEFSTYDSDLDDKDFEFTQDIDINILKDVLTEIINQKKA